MKQMILDDAHLDAVGKIHIILVLAHTIVSIEVKPRIKVTL